MPIDSENVGRGIALSLGVGRVDKKLDLVPQLFG
jgi:hypothetical protein